MAVLLARVPAQGAAAAHALSLQAQGGAVRVGGSPWAWLHRAATCQGIVYDVACTAMRSWHLPSMLESVCSQICEPAREACK